MEEESSIKIKKADDIGFDEVYCLWWVCPNCSVEDIRSNTSYCPDCGIKIDWID